jgi:hypothetical protein
MRWETIDHWNRPCSEHIPSHGRNIPGVGCNRARWENVAQPKGCMNPNAAKEDGKSLKTFLDIENTTH